MRAAIGALFFAVACGGSPDGTTDATTPTDTDSTTEPPVACTALVEGRWASSSENCFGMGMDADLTLDAEGCEFTFSNWNMSMDAPEGGVVTGSDVTLTGAGWNDCVGTTDGTTLDAVCGSGCNFHMEVQ